MHQRTATEELIQQALNEDYIHYGDKSITYGNRSGRTSARSKSNSPENLLSKA